jgi:hypothetical protein
MASLAAIALMQAHALERIEAATTTLAERLGVTFTTPRALPTQDPRLRRVRDLERMASILEQVNAATADRAPQMRRKGAA